MINFITFNYIAILDIVLYIAILYYFLEKLMPNKRNMFVLLILSGFFIHSILLRILLVSFLISFLITIKNIADFPKVLKLIASLSLLLGVVEFPFYILDVQFGWIFSKILFFVLIWFLYDNNPSETKERIGTSLAVITLILLLMIGGI